jgi:hypothetical protein
MGGMPPAQFLSRGNSDSESIRNHALNNEYIIKHNNTLYPKNERGIRASKDTPSLINYVKIRSVPITCRYGCIQKRCIPQKLPGQTWHMIHIYIYMLISNSVSTICPEVQPFVATCRGLFSLEVKTCPRVGAHRVAPVDSQRPVLRYIYI